MLQQKLKIVLKNYLCAKVQYKSELNSKILKSNNNNNNNNSLYSSDKNTYQMLQQKLKII